MFEKGAEEYLEKHNYTKGYIGYFASGYCEQAFKDGAEFGYNKCFEQIRKIMNEHTRLDCIIPELLRLKENE